MNDHIRMSHLVFDEGYLGQNPPFIVEVTGEGSIHFSRIDRRGMNEGVEMDWKIEPKELAKLSDLLDQLFE